MLTTRASGSTFASLVSRRSSSPTPRAIGLRPHLLPKPLPRAQCGPDRSTSRVRDALSVSYLFPSQCLKSWPDRPRVDRRSPMPESLAKSYDWQRHRHTHQFDHDCSIAGFGRDRIARTPHLRDVVENHERPVASGNLCPDSTLDVALIAPDQAAACAKFTKLGSAARCAPR